MRKTIYIAITILLVSTSCSKEFVELTSENELNAGNFYQTENEFNAAVIATYAKLQGQVSLYFELV